MTGFVFFSDSEEIQKKEIVEETIYQEEIENKSNITETFFEKILKENKEMHVIIYMLKIINIFLFILTVESKVQTLLKKKTFPE